MTTIRKALSSLAGRVRALSRLTAYDVHLQRRKFGALLRHTLAGRGRLPAFAEIAIETSSYCNRHCGACPVSVAPRARQTMPDAVFDTLLAELREMRYAGRIALHFFNEPLLDPDIVRKVGQLARAAPRASIEMNSNGDYLTIELAEQLVAAGLRYMLVTAYTASAYARLQRLRQGFGRRLRSRIVIMRAPVFVGNRAGSLAHLAIGAPLRADCFQPSNKLVVNVLGQVVMCTNDYFARSVMGQVGQGSLLAIWHGPAFEAARALLRRGERHLLPNCAGCNLVSTPLTTRYLSAQEAARRG